MNVKRNNDGKYLKILSLFDTREDVDAEKRIQLITYLYFKVCVDKKAKERQTEKFYRIVNALLNNIKTAFRRKEVAGSLLFDHLENATRGI